MKLPFRFALGPLLRLHFRKVNKLCNHDTFYFSLQYTYLFGTLGLFVNVKHLRNHFGNPPITNSKDILNMHDMKIIATSMGLVQYFCLLIGCITYNPALFLPHLLVQFVAIVCSLFNALTFLVPLNMKSVCKLVHITFSVLLMSFNWMQEFCVFHGSLCICDL